MISEVSPSTKLKIQIDNLLKLLKSKLMEMPSSNRVKVSMIYINKHLLISLTDIQLSKSLSLLPSDIKYPLGFVPHREVKGHFQFVPPATIKMVGSYLLNTCLKKRENINLSLHIPQVSDCLHVSVFLHLFNHRNVFNQKII